LPDCNGFAPFRGGYRTTCLARIGATIFDHIATARGDEKIMVNRYQRLLTGSWLFAMACIVSASIAPAIAAAPKSTFSLSSADPQLAVSVPLIYTAKAFGCSGGNLSPELHWSGAPAATQSFVLTLFDRDERSTPSGWWHWVVYDLPKTTTNLPKGAGAEHSGALPAGTLQGRTDLGEDAYHGPCPAAGDPPHRYVFTIYALNVAKLPVPGDSSGAMVTSIVQEHLLGKAVFVAHYGRPKN
jgi:Raf kinase inhibitor-like YbhB/YbcL family protein